MSSEHLNAMNVDRFLAAMSGIHLEKLEIRIHHGIQTLNDKSKRESTGILNYEDQSANESINTEEMQRNNYEKKVPIFNCIIYKMSKRLFGFADTVEHLKSV